MNTPKFSPGDPVWVIGGGKAGITGKRYAGEIIDYDTPCLKANWYITHVFDMPSDRVDGLWSAPENLLEPRLPPPPNELTFWGECVWQPKKETVS